ncbi:class I SAM-dependent methyltransferase [uncultured Croceitalea sp.]|uniref:class I SAM-dependent methyltransferase n=1 Tax=uncultured Croceitalea sp. TaxID=1798908 RepID=UPI00330571B3
MKLFLKTKDFFSSQESFELHHDETLDMLVTKPVPLDLSKYYENDAYISHTDSNKGLLNKVYLKVKNYSLKKKVVLIDSFGATKKTLLDVGAGTGDFLLAAKKANWNVSGVEPNKTAQKRASEKGISLEERLDVFSGEKFEVITLWHVLEHLPDLEEQIKLVNSLLEDEGTLIVAVPNFKSYDAEHYGKFWAAYDVPRHLWHFSKTAIQLLFEKRQMKLVQIKPMLFDSFYVSLLSEKYQNGRQNIFKAFWIGLWSNLKAYQTKEYSSHIYILQKMH